MDKEEGEVIEEGDENGYVNNTVFRNMELGPLSEFIANNGEITLGKDIIKFYEHSFYQNDIDEILSNWDNILSFQYHTYLKTQDDVE